MQFHIDNNGANQFKRATEEINNNIIEKLLDLSIQSVTPHDRAAKNDTSICEEIGREIQRATNAIPESAE